MFLSWLVPIDMAAQDITLGLFRRERGMAILFSIVSFDHGREFTRSRTIENPFIGLRWDVSDDRRRQRSDHDNIAVVEVVDLYILGMTKVDDFDGPCQDNGSAGGWLVGGHVGAAKALCS